MFPVLQAARAHSLSLTDISFSLEKPTEGPHTSTTNMVNVPSIHDIARRVFHDVSLYDSLPPEQQKNPRIISVLLTKDPDRFPQLPEDIQTNPHLQLCAFVAAYFLQKKPLFDEMRGRYPLCHTCEESLIGAFSHPGILPHRTNALWDILPFVLYQPDATSPLALQTRVSDELKKDPLLAEETIEKKGGGVLSFFSPALRDNAYLARLAYRSSPEIISDLSTRLQSDPTFLQSLRCS